MISTPALQFVFWKSQFQISVQKLAILTEVSQVFLSSFGQSL